MEALFPEIWKSQLPIKTYSYPPSVEQANGKYTTLCFTYWIKIWDQSTCTALTEITNKWLSYVDEKIMVGTVLLNFNVEFDIVCKTIANKFNCAWIVVQQQLLDE